ncbi:MAG: hypothetical protein ACPGO3_09445 [Magnetospiraceae bacterium]
MRKVVIKKHQRKRIWNVYPGSLFRVVEFDAEPVRRGEKLGGRVVVLRSRLWKRITPLEADLQEQNALPRSIVNTFYSIYVTPDTDIKITYEPFRFTLATGLFMLGGAVIASTIAFIAMTVLTKGG